MRSPSKGSSLLISLCLAACLALGHRPGGTSTPARAAEEPPPKATNPQTAQQPAGSYNLIWPSEDFSHANWGPLENASIESNVDTAPTGAKTAARLSEDTTNGRHRIEGKTGGLQPGSSYVLSLYVKPAGRAGIMLEMRDRPSHKYGTARFAIEERRVLLTSGDTTSAGIDPAPNGWVRCWAIMPYDDGDAFLSFALLGAPDFAPAYGGDGKSGLLIWGAQLGPAGPSAYVTTTDGPAPPR
jgi:hypothetical protein